MAAAKNEGFKDHVQHRAGTLKGVYHFASQELDKYNEKLSNLEARVHEAMAHGKDGDDMKKLETRLASVHGGGGGQGQLIELERQVQAATR